MENLYAIELHKSYVLGLNIFLSVVNTKTTIYFGFFSFKWFRRCWLQFYGGNYSL